MPNGGVRCSLTARVGAMFQLRRQQLNGYRLIHKTLLLGLRWVAGLAAISACIQSCETEENGHGKISASCSPLQRQRSTESRNRNNRRSWWPSRGLSMEWFKLG